MPRFDAIIQVFSFSEMKSPMSKSLEEKAKPERVKQLVLLTVAAVLIGMGVTWFRVAAISACLAVRDARTVTVAMTLSMLLLPLAGWAHYRWTRNVHWKKRIMQIYVFCTVGLLFTALLACFFHTSWSVALLVFGIKFFATYTFFPFWQLVSRIFPGKGGCYESILISTGFPIAQIIAGSTSSSLVTHLGSASPFVLAIFTTLAATLLIRSSLSRLPDHQLNESGKSQKLKAEASAKKANRRTLIATVFSISAMVTITSVIVNHLFQSSADSFLHDPAQLTHALGIVEVIIGAGELLVMFFLSNRLIERFGVLPGLVLMPVLIGATATILMCYAWPSVVVFVVAASAKIITAIVRPAIYKPSIKLLIDLLDVQPRMKVVARIETVSKPVAATLAGGLMLIISSFFLEGVFMIALFLLVFSVCWSVLGYRATRVFATRASLAE